MRRKLKKRRSARVITLDNNMRIKAVPAVVGGILFAVVCAVVVALVFVFYNWMTAKAPALGVVIPKILYVLLVVACSYVAANYFNTRSLVPSISVGGLCLLMSVVFTISAYDWAGLLGATIPLKIVLTLIGVVAGYFLVDVLYLSWLPVREEDDSYFVDEEYDPDYVPGTYDESQYVDYNNLPKY